MLLTVYLRVLKGAIKAEPELLDELGIILRLDPATRAYAASVGKAVSDLTTFEKQQAVVNAVLEQGEEKFGQLSNIDPNPYTQLSAAFQDIITTTLGFVNSGIGPFITLLTENVQILTGALLIFGTSIAKRALPILQEMGILVSENLAKGISNLADQLESEDIAAAIFEGFEDDLKNKAGLFDDVADQVKTSFAELGDAVPTDLRTKLNKTLGTLGDDALRISGSIALVDEALEELDNTVEKGTDLYTRRKLALLEVRAALQTYNLGLQKLRVEQTLLGKSVQWVTLQYETLVKTLKLVKFGAVQGFVAGTEEGFFKLGENIKKFRLSLTDIDTKGRLASTTIKSLATATFAFSGAVGSLIRAIPVIGQIVAAFGLLKAGVGFVFDLFRDAKAVEKFNDSISDSESAVKTASKAADNYNKTLSDFCKV
jgi:hypothetical protein